MAVVDRGRGEESVLEGYVGGHGISLIPYWGGQKFEFRLCVDN